MFGDFAVGKAVEKGQDEHPAMLAGQLPERPASERHLGTALDAAVEHRLRRLVVGKGLGRDPPAGLPEAIDQAAAGQQRDEGRLATPGRVEPGGMAPEIQEHFLDDLFPFRLGAALAPDERQHETAVTFETSLHGSRLALGNEGQEGRWNGGGGGAEKNGEEHAERV